MTSPSSPPYNPDAEASVVSQLLARPGQIPEVVGAGLEPGHFHGAGYKSLYRAISEAYYADEPIDPLVIGELVAKDLARAWNLEEVQAVRKVEALAARTWPGRVVDHAKIVQRDSRYRDLLTLAQRIVEGVASEDDEPEAIASNASQAAMEVATGSVSAQELITFERLGQNFITHQRGVMAARDAGLEIGAYFGMSFLDTFLRGLRPSELFVLGGPPGAGKSAVAWRAAVSFAERQARRPRDRQVATLVLSLEMPEELSSSRFAQAITGVDGGRLREGRTDEADISKIIAEWAARRELPLVVNHSSELSTSQLRALVTEAIRRHNVGLIVLDHFRYFRTDTRFRNPNDEDDAKVRFLVVDVARRLNVAVICLAHTSKAHEQREDRKPRLADLRGSGQIAADASFVAFVHRPYEYASEDDIDEGRVKRTDAELLWEKSRQGLTGKTKFHFDGSTMTIY